MDLFGIIGTINTFTSNTFAGLTIIGDGPASGLDWKRPHFTQLAYLLRRQQSFFSSHGRERTFGPDLDLASQTLAGIGTINGKLVVSAGAIISPAGTNTTIGITAGANSTGTIVRATMLAQWRKLSSSRMVRV